ncbi:hypothetical protein [Puniceibacterium sp. IMCC21224]|uniref:hypothetical protein n=1 Tax=Puniceibacterium sp. IMCC21224 TaxID=1618204 RepID=UPI00065CC845|nr:hypothetical protein [Puniceibacterium sp. IMCC21224]KMK66432.1 dynamin family protein [Puniceibacterium sp. IMCC21224]
MNAPLLQKPRGVKAITGGDSPVISLVVGGEVNSGKSSVINLLVRKNIVPSFFGERKRPMIVVRHGAQPCAIVHDMSGASRTFDAVEDCEDLADADLCEIFTDAPHMAGIELIEAPFSHDGELGDDTFTLMAAADLLIWVTIGSQAWRLTERTILARLPKAQREHSILVVSRGDKLKSAREIEKIQSRLESEAADFFGDILFMHASKRMIDASAGSDESWSIAKGDMLSGLVADYAKKSRKRPEIEPDIAQVATPEPEMDEYTEQSAAEVIEEPAIAAKAPEDTAKVDAPMAEVASAPPVDETRTLETEAVTAELREFVSGLNSIVASGLIDVKDSSRCTVLAGDETVAHATGRASHDCLKHQSQFYRYAGADVGMEQTLITLSDHFFLYQPSGDGKTVIYALCKTAKINSGIARNALRRMGNLWDNHCAGAMGQETPIAIN